MAYFFHTHYLLSLQFFIQGPRQLQYHGAGDSGVRGALKFPAVPLRRVVLGVVVAGQDQATLSRRVESRDDVGERQLAVGRHRPEAVQGDLPASPQGAQGGFDVLVGEHNPTQQNTHQQQAAQHNAVPPRL